MTDDTNQPPGIDLLVQVASFRALALYEELNRGGLHGTLAVPGIFAGAAIGQLVGTGMTDDKICEFVMSIVDSVRKRARELGVVIPHDPPRDLC